MDRVPVPEHLYNKRMLSLVNSFPTLRGRFTHWDALEFSAWACSEEPSSGMRHAARFILEVWNPYDEWPCGRFDWNCAMRMWDDGHRKAFIAWLQDPFYP